LITSWDAKFKPEEISVAEICKRKKNDKIENMKIFFMAFVDV